jgi:hypothetical protein
MSLDRRGLIWILLATAALLLLIAIGAVVAYLALRERPVTAASGWQDPIAAVAPDKIAPELALYPLAGASELETIDAAIDNNEIHTAYAALVFALDLRDEQRSGRLLQIGSRFTAAEEADMARLAYQQVYDLAILSPEMSDPIRTDALLADGRSWAGMSQKEEAARAYDQVYTIAVRSPYLQVAYRRDLLNQLATAYDDLGQAESADLCRQQIDKLTQGAESPLSSPVSEAIELLANPQTSISSAEIGVLEESRRQAAYSVLQAANGGAAPPSDLVNSLAEALKAEDLAKLVFYQQEREATTQPSRRVNVDWALIDWLTLKCRVAAQGFGLSIVPEWEQQAADVQSELSKAYEALRFDYEDLVTSLPDAALMEPGRYGVRRMSILAGRLGQYPNYPEQQTADKLQEAARNMVAAGVVEPLYVDVQPGKNGLWFFLSPADQYGQAASSP